MTTECTETVTGALPAWVPHAVKHYIAHTEEGASIRALARQAGCHPSTVMRQVRKFELRRDDPLVDAALARLGAGETGGPSDGGAGADEDGAAQSLDRALGTALARLCDPGAVLVVAEGLERAAIVRDVGGESVRSAVVERMTAEALALRDWIGCAGTGRVARYRVTPAGRSEHGRRVAMRENRVRSLAGEEAEFESGRALDAALARAESRPETTQRRVAPVDTPLAALGRRRDRDGRPFLSPELIAAGERLREDFELSQMAGVAAGGSASGEGSEAAAAGRRLARALNELGPGLSDVALRCCCHLEGLERCETRMGWSARSGKVVLRIALQRLQVFYQSGTMGAAFIG